MVTNSKCISLHIFKWKMLTVRPLVLFLSLFSTRNFDFQYKHIAQTSNTLSLKHNGLSLWKPWFKHLMSHFFLIGTALLAGNRCIQPSTKDSLLTLRFHLTLLLRTAFITPFGKKLAALTQTSRFHHFSLDQSKAKYLSTRYSAARKSKHAQI